jgi:hypothetical protein
MLRVRTPALARGFGSAPAGARRPSGRHLPGRREAHQLEAAAGLLARAQLLHEFRMRRVVVAHEHREAGGRRGAAARGQAGRPIATPTVSPKASTARAAPCAAFRKGMERCFATTDM